MGHFSREGNVILDNIKHQETDQYKIAVFSCIVGAYDSIIDPVFAEPGVDYLMFTDQDIPSCSVWRKIDITRMKEYGQISNAEMNRKIKIFQCDILKQYDYTIYIDGNIELVSGVSPIISEMGNCYFGVHYHRSRDCNYDEVVSVKHLKRVTGEEMDKQIEHYRAQGYPEHYGLYENSILIRDNRDKTTDDLMKEWWDEYKRFPTRDQLSLPYVIWNGQYNKDRILILGQDLERNTRFNRINQHL